MITSFKEFFICDNINETDTHSPEKLSQLIVDELKNDRPSYRKIADFISQGADLNLPVDGKRIIEYAVTAGNSGIVMNLLNQGVDLYSDNGAPLPLIEAVIRSHAIPAIKANIIRLLLKAGLDPNWVQRPGDLAPLSLIIKLSNDIRGISSLIEYGAKVNNRDADGLTALHHAACRVLPEIPDIIKMLIDAGAKIDAIDKDGNTPLHLAARFNEAPVLKTLLTAGASKDIKNKNGQTPWEYAKLKMREMCPELKP